MKYKKLTLVFLVILFLLIFSINLNAFSFETTEGEVYNFSFEFNEDDYDFFIRDGVKYDNYIRVYAVPQGTVKLTYGMNGEEKTVFFKNISSDTITYYNMCVKKSNIVGGVVGLDDWHTIYEIEVEPLEVFNLGLRNYENSILYSDNTVYNEDGTIFFTQAPLGALGKIMSKIPTTGIMYQIVTILPLILVVVVSFLGLRKAWSLLSTQLRQV